MIVRIEPSFAAGTAAAPPSKSMSHRFLLCAGLAEGESVIRNVAESEDVLATADCLNALGASCVLRDGTAHVTGAAVTEPGAPAVLPCRESGSTLRFFIPVSLLAEREVTFTGKGRLMQRPLGVYEDICRKQGITYEKAEDHLRIRGRLRFGEYRLPGNVSSQFISGLLFALPLLPGDSTLRLLPPVESRPYIDMTLQALSSFGVSAAWREENALFVPGGQTYRAGEVIVEGDHSNAAFLQALSLCGGKVQVTGLDKHSLQGDRVFPAYLERLRQGPAKLDIADCPDLGPVLFAAAALAHGGTFTGTDRLKLKDSDRGRAMQTELAKFGVTQRAGANEMTVVNEGMHAPDAPLFGHNDHRVVMALSVLAVRTGGEITGAEAVNKSFPDFFAQLERLGVKLSYGLDQ